jgi:hypothetical protein
MTTLEISVQYSGYKRKMDRRSASGLKGEDSGNRLSTNILLALKTMFPDPLLQKKEKAVEAEKVKLPQPQEGATIDKKDIPPS